MLGCWFPFCMAVVTVGLHNKGMASPCTAPWSQESLILPITGGETEVCEAAVVC